LNALLNLDKATKDEIKMLMHKISYNTQDLSAMFNMRNYH